MKENPILEFTRWILRNTIGGIDRIGGQPLTSRIIPACRPPHTDIRTYPVNIFGMARRLFPRQIDSSLAKHTVSYLNVCMCS